MSRDPAQATEDTLLRAHHTQRPIQPDLVVGGGRAHSAGSAHSADPGDTHSAPYNPRSLHLLVEVVLGRGRCRLTVSPGTYTAMPCAMHTGSETLSVQLLREQHFPKSNIHTYIHTCVYMYMYIKKSTNMVINKIHRHLIWHFKILKLCQVD